MLLVAMCLSQERTFIVRSQSLEIILATYIGQNYNSGFMFIQFDQNKLISEEDQCKLT